LIEESRDGRKHVVIAGSSGFIGSRLVHLFKSWRVTTLDRSPAERAGIESFKWDGETLGEWTSCLEGADAIINLSGAPISVKWDAVNKEKIRASRINSTQAIGSALAKVPNPPRVWINGSAVGFYGDRGDTVLYETAEAGKGFLSDICRSWEAAAQDAAPPETRLVLMRTGFVLGRGGGAFKPLRNLALFGLGGSAGSGNQWVPWIHLDDLCRMFIWAAENERLRGPVNGSAPEPVRNRDLMTKLRKELNRPWAPPAPSFALKVLGEIAGPDSELLLDSQRAVPRAAIDSGFTWNFPSIGEALHDLVRSPQPGAFLA
jgi:uncharacterized protein (TIGR01777 family)